MAGGGQVEHVGQGGDRVSGAQARHRHEGQSLGGLHRGEGRRLAHLLGFGGQRSELFGAGSADGLHLGHLLLELGRLGHRQAQGGDNRATGEGELRPQSAGTLAQIFEPFCGIALGLGQTLVNAGCVGLQIERGVAEIAAARNYTVTLRMNGFYHTPSHGQC